MLDNTFVKNNKILLIFAFFVILLSGIFTVNEKQTAIILQFGEVKRVIKTAGLKFKIPLIQKALFLDNRILDCNIPASEVISAEKKRLIVDIFAKYKINDPLLVYQTAINEKGVESRLRSILNSSMRQIIGEIQMKELLTDKRSQIINRIRDVTNTQASKLGVEVIDVRIKRSDLPAANSEAIYLRMQTEREREAREIRAEGESEATKIIATADSQKEIIISKAIQQSEFIKGTADKEAINIYAKVFSKDKDFFEFYQTMETYKTGLKNKDLILSDDTAVFNKLKKGS